MLSMLSSILFAWRMYLAERAIFSLAAGLILSKRGTTWWRILFLKASSSKFVESVTKSCFFLLGIAIYPVGWCREEGAEYFRFWGRWLLIRLLQILLTDSEVKFLHCHRDDGPHKCLLHASLLLIGKNSCSVSCVQPFRYLPCANGHKHKYQNGFETNWFPVVGTDLYKIARLCHSLRREGESYSAQQKYSVLYFQDKQ